MSTASHRRCVGSMVSVGYIHIRSVSPHRRLCVFVVASCSGCVFVDDNVSVVIVVPFATLVVLGCLRGVRPRLRLLATRASLPLSLFVCGFSRPRLVARVHKRYFPQRRLIFASHTRTRTIARSRSCRASLSIPVSTVAADARETSYQWRHPLRHLDIDRENVH